VIKVAVASQCVDPSLVNLEPRIMTDTLLNSGRPRSFLRAVAAGRAVLTVSSEPDLFIDGLSCGDQPLAHHLVHQGLLAPCRPGCPGERVPATLTPAGLIAIGS
jgi:hypothetical protein